MVYKRIWALFMAILTVFFIVACIPSLPVIADGSRNSDEPSPLSITDSVGSGMYFLPLYDEITGFTPAKRLYVLPSEAVVCEGQNVSGCMPVYKNCGQVSDTNGIESITPRAP